METFENFRGRKKSVGVVLPTFVYKIVNIIAVPSFDRTFRSCI